MSLSQGDIGVEGPPGVEGPLGVEGPPGYRIIRQSGGVVTPSDVDVITRALDEAPFWEEATPSSNVFVRATVVAVAISIVPLVLVTIACMPIIVPWMLYGRTKFTSASAAKRALKLVQCTYKPKYKIEVARVTEDFGKYEVVVKWAHLGDKIFNFTYVEVSPTGIQLGLTKTN